jgi:ABC-type Fe3+/spermidine/putrescine transport system ATPase subunit
LCTSPALVDCKTIQICAECEKDFVGRNVLVSVRPERILVRKELKGLAENVFDGEVQEALFKGSFMAYRVKIADGPLMNVQVQNLEDVRFNVGDRVQVGWRTENSIVVTA